jgi:hypothetical protein
MPSGRKRLRTVAAAPDRLSHRGAENRSHIGEMADVRCIRLGKTTWQMHRNGSGGSIRQPR